MSTQTTPIEKSFVESQAVQTTPTKPEKVDIRLGGKFSKSILRDVLVEEWYEASELFHEARPNFSVGEILARVRLPWGGTEVISERNILTPLNPKLPEPEIKVKAAANCIV